MNQTRRNSALLPFALAGLAAMCVIGLVGFEVLRRLGTEESIRDAKTVSRLSADGMIRQNVTEGVLAGDSAAVARIDRVVREQVLRDGVVRVKLWSREGRIVYSDEHRLIGNRYELAEEEIAAFRSGQVAAEVSDLSEPENRFERENGKLLEVYLPIKTPAGETLLYESYQRFSSVTAGGRKVWIVFLPALLGGLALLWLVSLPLAARMVRRISEAQHERETMLRRAIDSSEVERRRIAADLHDGVVQDLVATSYVLAAGADRVNGDGDPESSQALRQGAAMTRSSIKALRSLVVDIYPPNLHRAGLASALSDVATAFSARGLPVEVSVADPLPLSDRTEALLFRCAQEALRNALKHAGATRATVSVTAHGDLARLEVIDDGGGFDPAVLAARERDGHVGLRLLRDLTTDSGGTFELDSTPGQGTTLRIEVPA